MYSRPCFTATKSSTRLLFCPTSFFLLYRFALSFRNSLTAFFRALFPLSTLAALSCSSFLEILELALEWATLCPSRCRGFEPLGNCSCDR